MSCSGTFNTTDSYGSGKLAKLLASGLLLLLSFSAGAPRASALSFELDSIASWGKFPHFCIDVYRWGDRFFNSYDSTYVKGSGKRFNIKTKFNTWGDIYDFRFPSGYRMDMVSRPSTTVGLHLTYMAVSVGYDMNFSKYFSGGVEARKQFNVQFNCALFAAEYYNIINDIGTTITRMGPQGDVQKTKINFPDLNNSCSGLELYYFFNHKHYSQGAAFYYSKIQQRSSGTLLVGLSYSKQKFHFDFTSLLSGNEPLQNTEGKEIPAPPIPESWRYNYMVRNINYGLRIGYAYNWVPRKGWCVGGMATLTPALRDGYINYPSERDYSFGLNGHLRVSVIYNYNRRWFYGMVTRIEGNFISDKEHSLISSNYAIEFSAGFRFDLWR